MFGVRLLHLGDGDVPGPEVYWMSDWDQWYRLAFQAVLIQGEGVTALIGTGPAEDLGPMNEQWAGFLGERAAMRREQGQWLPDQLAAHGVALEEVTHVLLTPLQLYTTSNIPLFPNARFCLTERGWTHFHRTKRHPHDDRWSCLPPHVLSYLTHDAWDRVRLLADEDEVVPGIRTWWTGSHHRASMAVEIDSTAGVVTVTDAYFTRRNLDTDQPIGICENIYEAMAAHERVRRVADVPLTIYDADQLIRYPDGVVAAVPGS
ncbi:hypothetical protein OG884_05285 [Streptosporangium sp. NBC_01755]|uniref:hypothetical protein n=1 Tax=Streptosporangium sp. NBC_01755 TaxID=2975949 RepID=UPI002DD8B485|nr:hypothetical protein [Streptosporangium sp. NBC_01755]WSD01344.1 hypothetical protein OG884_05285 [Streptosporangium sp. NBC_01755]